MFFSTFWQELFRLSGTKLISSTNYHPKTNEKTEIVNKCVEGYLQNYVSGQKRTWIKRFHLGENCYNTTYHMSIRMSPFRALYGYDSPFFLDLAFRESRAPKAKDWL